MSILAALINPLPQKNEDKYLAYINSAKWRKKADKIKKRDNYQCQTCLETERLEVHHKTYDNLYHEQPEDLITLCAWCHEAITSSIRARRYAKRELDPADIPENHRTYQEKGARDVSPDFEVSDYRRLTPVNAQRATRRPVKQMV